MANRRFGRRRYATRERTREPARRKPPKSVGKELSGLGVPLGVFNTLIPAVERQLGSHAPQGDVSPQAINDPVLWTPTGVARSSAPETVGAASSPGAAVLKGFKL